MNKSSGWFVFVPFGLILGFAGLRVQGVNAPTTSSQPVVQTESSFQAEADKVREARVACINKATTIPEMSKCYDLK